MNDKIRINLNLAGTTYPVFIDRKDEEIVREAAKQVNIRFNRNQLEHPEMSPEKVMAITAFELSLQMQDQKERNDTEPYTNKRSARCPFQRNDIGATHGKGSEEKRKQITHCLGLPPARERFGQCFLFLIH